MLRSVARAFCHAFIVAAAEHAQAHQNTGEDAAAAKAVGKRAEIYAEGRTVGLSLTGWSVGGGGRGRLTSMVADA